MRFGPHRATAGRRCRLVVSFAVLATGWAQLARADAGPTLQIEIDARDLPRRLLHTRMQIPCQAGKLKLWFPKWVPGTHGPYGPVQNVGGMRLLTPQGQALAWRRDELEPYRIECDVPDGTIEITVQLDMICNEPASQAAAYLSYGNHAVGIINWGTCLLYPEGPSRDDIQAHLYLRLPSKWKYATALKTEGTRDGRSSFQTMSLTDLVDCPLIAGEHFARSRSTPGPFRRHSSTLCLNRRPRSKSARRSSRSTAR